MDPLAKFQKQAEEYELSDAKKKEQEEKKAKADEEALEKAEKSNKVEAKIKQIKDVMKTEKKNGLKLLSESLKKELSYNNLQSAGKIDNYKTRLRRIIDGTGVSLAGSSKKGMYLINSSDGTVYDPDKPEGKKSFLVSGPKKIKKPSEKKPIEPQDDPSKLGPKTIEDIIAKESDEEFGTAVYTKYLTEKEEKRVKSRLGKKEKERKDEINRLNQIKERIQRGETPELSKSDKDKVKRLIEKERTEEEEKKKDIYGLIPKKKTTKPPRMISAKVAEKVGKQMEQKLWDRLEKETDEIEKNKIKEMLVNILQNPELMKVKSRQQQMREAFEKRETTKKQKEALLKELKESTVKTYEPVKRELTEEEKRIDDILKGYKEEIEQVESKQKKPGTPPKQKTPMPSTKPKTLKPSTKQKQTEPKKFTEPPEPLKEEGKKIFSKEDAEKSMIEGAKKKLESELDEARIKDILGPSYEGSYDELVAKRIKEDEERKKSKTRKILDSFLQAMGAGSSQKKQTEETQKLTDDPRAIQEQLNRDLGKLEKDFRNEYEAPDDEIKRQIWLAETTYEKASSSRDTGSEFIDNRQNDDRQTFNPNMRLDDWYETRETKYQNEYINLYNNQYRELNPTEYESKYDSFGQEALLEGEFKHNIELYDIMIKSQVKQIEHMRNQSIRDKDGKVDPSKQYTLGDYFQMFNFDDSAQKEQKGRLIDEIRTFARDNMIPMGSEIKLEDMSLESLKSIATDLEVAEDLTMDTYGSQFGNLLDLYEASRQIGLNNKILERPEIKETYIGRALKRLDQEMEGGSLKNIKSKFGDILKGMTIPIKAMVGEVGIGDIATGLKAAKSTYDITTGLGRTIFGGEEKEREVKEEKEETADENIIRELERMRAGDKKFRGQDGLYYPKSQPITPYRFPEPNENYTGVRLIQNAVTNYLNDTSLYGGYYTSEFANEI